MADETVKLKGKDLLERLFSDPDSGITLESGLTKSQVDKLVSDIDSHYGRVITGYKENIKDLTKENETFKADFAVVNQAKREAKAAELEKATGVKASIILKHGGDTLEGMKTFAEETAKELNIKPPEDKKTPPGDNGGAPPPEGNKGDKDFKPDPNTSAGSGEPTTEQLDAMSPKEYIATREAQMKKK